MIVDRSELARIHFQGVGIELGVASGRFSETILRRSGCDLLYSIDRWSDHHDAKQHLSAVQRLARFGRRSMVLRMTFAEAAALLSERQFDFIYIDGYAHTGQEKGATLREWWPLLKPGGIFAGHDYSPAWPLTCQAVDAFAASVGQAVSATTEPNYPSWWLFKTHPAREAA